MSSYNHHQNHQNHPESPNLSSDSLRDSLLPVSLESEAEIIFTPPMPGAIPAVSGERTIRLGGADLGVPGHVVKDVDEEGMLIGPSHPIFTGPQNPLNPQLSVPPGARFDPINPVSPGGFYSPGEPDFDDLLPPGPPNNPAFSIRPPPKNKSGTFGPFGHPHGAPPGSGNPPFFM